MEPYLPAKEIFHVRNLAMRQRKTHFLETPMFVAIAMQNIIHATYAGTRYHRYPSSGVAKRLHSLREILGVWIDAAH